MAAKKANVRKTTAAASRNGKPVKTSTSAKKKKARRKSWAELAREATMLAWQETYAKRDKMLIDYPRD